jgi:hypothetical protein
VIGPRAPTFRGWAAGAAAVAAAAFVVAVVAATMLVTELHPGAPAAVARRGQTGPARLTSVLTFGVGIYALLASLGLSGWARSRRLGLVTSVAAGAAAALVTAVTAAVGEGD